MNTVLLAVPLIVFSLVVMLGFVGCWLDSEGKGSPPDGDGNGNGNGPPPPPPYADAVNASGPIAYWRLSDATGSVTAKDEIGAQPSGDHPGEYQGTVVLGQPPGLNLSDSAATPARFDGTGHVEVPHAPAFEMTAFTVEALVSPESVVSPGVIVGHMTPSGHVSMSGGWALTILPRADSDHPDIDGHFKAVVSDGSGAVGPDPVAFDLTKLGAAWHVAMTFDGTTLTLYWEGAKQAWGDFPHAPNVSEPIRVGTDFKGALQEVAVYDRALAATEIGAHYSSNTPPDQDP